MKTSQRPQRASRGAGVLVAMFVATVLSSCATGTSSTQSSESQAPCPVEPFNIVVTTNVWASVVDQLVGTCANVSTVITSSAADPHDFEPTAATSALFSDAELVIMNGLGYDAWANKIIGSLGDAAPAVLNLGEAVGLQPGANPHIWYSPEYVVKAAAAITSRVGEVDGQATQYFNNQAKTFGVALEPYLAKVAAIKRQHSGTKIGATESVFNYMADATGLIITTPPGFITAIATDSEPTTRDVALFRQQLESGVDKVLIFNSQTDGALTSQMREVAQSNNVPVVSITESLDPVDSTFQAWQLAQLDALAQALG